MMTLSLPFEVLYILHCFAKQNKEAYLVGGAVRDLLLNQADRPVKDFDFATNAHPEEIQQLFDNAFYENKFGTVSLNHDDLLQLLKKYQLPAADLSTTKKEPTSTKVRIIDLKNASKIHVSLRENKQNVDQTENEQNLVPAFEMTTYRSDGLYNDHRRPETVDFGHSLEEDLKRRDFTVNAMAISLDPAYLEEVFANSILQTDYLINEENFTLIDLHHGQEDLQLRVLRTVGEADERFKEDALRMLRAIRLAVQLNMDIETNTYFAIKFNKDLLRFVSMERVRDEFLGILKSQNPAKGIEMLDESGLLEQIIPELYQGRGMQQRGHHISDVWTHSIDALRHCPSTDPVVRLATLLHDIGKPSTYQEDEHSQITFYNHDVLGARTASYVAKRLRMSKKDIQRIFTLVRYHMFYYQPHHTDAAIRRFMRKVGLENIDDILDLREGDRLGSGAKKTSWRLEEMKQRVIEQLNQPAGLDDLAINGNDLMQELGIKPGPQLGQILHHLLEIVLEDPTRNTRENLLDEAKSYSDQ
jgi:putative nucleotidyltransferase with HDIG domain